MTYRTEFPDYPVADMPTMPEGFVDESWHNNACPSFFNADLNIRIWVEYLDPALREYGPDSGRFLVVRPIDKSISDDFETLLETNDWHDVVQFFK